MMPRAPDYQKERGARQEARILALLAESPKTSTKLAELMHLGRCNVEIYMRRMRKSGRVFIAEYQRNHTGRPAPLWAAGNQQDAEFVALRRPCPVRTLADRLKTARKLLRTGHTSRELGEKMCVTKGTAQRYIAMLRDAEPRQVYIEGWRHPGHRGDLSPIYRMGDKPDAPKTRQTRADRYAAEKADPDRYERILQKNRARHAVAKAKAKPQGIFAALGV